MVSKENWINRNSLVNIHSRFSDSIEEESPGVSKSILGRLYIWDYTWFCCPWVQLEAKFFTDDALCCQQTASTHVPLASSQCTNRVENWIVSIFKSSRKSNCWMQLCNIEDVKSRSLNPCYLDPFSTLAIMTFVLECIQIDQSWASNIDTLSSKRSGKKVTTACRHLDAAL